MGFEHTFGTTAGSEARELLVQQDNVHSGDGLYVKLTQRTGYRNLAGWLTEESSRALYAALHTRYGTPAAPEPFRPSEGDVVRLLPGSRFSGGSTDLDGTTKVQVQGGPDGDGDYWVEALDGDNPGSHEYVLPAYLAPLTDAPAATIEVGKEYKLLPGATFSGGLRGWLAASNVSRVRVERVDTVDFFVTAIDGTRRGAQSLVSPHFLAPLDEEPSPTIEADKEYRLLPGARHSQMLFSSYLVDEGATRVKIGRGPDEDGDYWVTALDGKAKGDGAWIAARYIVPLDTPREWAVGDVAIVTVDKPWVAELYAGDRVRITELRNAAIGPYARVTFLSGRGSSSTFTTWNVALTDLRRP